MNWRRWTGIALVVVVASTGTAVSWVAQRTDEHRSASHLMDVHTSDLNQAIRTEIQRYGDTLADVAVAVGAQPDLTATGFNWITDTIRSRQLPGATSLDLIAETSDAGVAALQSFWRARGADGLALKPATRGQHAFTVFRRSFDGRQRPTGTDLYTVPEAAQALRDSRSVDGFAVSRAYVLLSDRTLPAAQQQLSFRLATPVYGAGQVFRGWLTMGVHGQDLLAATLQAQAPGMVAAELLERNGAHTQTVAAAANRAGQYPPTLDRVTRITIGVHTWTLKTFPADALLRASHQGVAGTTFRVAMTINVLLTLIVGLLASARNRAMSKVDAATAALRDDIERREQVETRLREREMQLQQMVLCDPLTGLANRAGLDARLDDLVEPHTEIALLLIDLDGFKQVNDSLGHAAGDTMLTEFARILRAGVRATDLVARLGGDEFVVLITDLPDELSAVATAERILAAAAATPVRVGDDPVTIRASIGVATGQIGDTPRELLRRADTAMYQAKNLGKHGFQVYDAGPVDGPAAHAPLAEDLAGAR